MADEHAGIAEGNPVWVEIFAADVPRGMYHQASAELYVSTTYSLPHHLAQSFYSAVFNWKFNDNTKSPKDEVVIFHFSGSSLFGGSITKADESERKRGAKSVKVYLFSNDLKKTMEVSSPPYSYTLSLG